MELTQLLPSVVADRPAVSIALTVTLVLVLQFAIRLYRQRSFFRDLPGPPHSFLLGHLPVMGAMAALFPPNNHPQAYFTEISRKYNLPGIFYLDLWPFAPSQVVLSDPALLEQVTVTKPLPQHQLGDDFLAPITGRNNIATANGPMWKEMHKAMVPAFSWSHIRSLTSLIIEECELFREALDKKATTGDVFSMEELGSKLTFDVIARIVLNMRLHAQTTGSVYLDDLKEMIRLADGATDIAVQFNPFLRLKAWWQRQRVLGRLNPSIKAKIQERFDLLKSEGVVPRKKDPDSILDLMLREKVATGLEKGTKLSTSDETMLLTNTKALLIGGHGTTTDSLCFIYMLLSKHPRVVTALRAEHSSLLNTTHSLTTQTLLSSPEKLQSLPYTEAVIKEALRLFPVGFGVRGAPPGTTLTVDGRALPIDNGLAIALNGHDVHYDAAYFPDPTVFKPERWLDGEGVPRPYFRTFGRGLRACLGQNLAVNELKIIMVMTLREYEFECVGAKGNEAPRCAHTDLDKVFGDMVFQELGLEAKPRGGMMMRVRRVEG